jgi:hypothetical protein
VPLHRAALAVAVLAVVGCGEVNGNRDRSSQSQVDGDEMDPNFTDTRIDIPESRSERER